MIFAGVWLEADHMNQTIWDGFGLEKLLSRTIYDHVGTADVVVESSAGTAAVGAEVVVRKGGTFVTRKLTNSTGGVAFAGWAGRKAPASHTVAVRTADNKTASRQFELAAGAHKSLTITVGAAHRLKADDRSESDDAMAWRAEPGASSATRELGWWLHVDRRFEATLHVMASEPELFTSVNVFHSNYSIAADGSLAVPSAASVSSWLVPLRRALPKAKVSVVLGLGHPDGQSDPFPAAAGNADFAPSVAKALSQHGLDGVNRTHATHVYCTVSKH